MRQNTDHIRATHAGSLPRPPELIAANDAKEADGITPEFLDLLETSVVDIVRRQGDLGIDIPNDGEYGHTMSGPVDCGAWWNYSFSRFGGLEPTEVPVCWGSWHGPHTADIPFADILGPVLQINAGGYSFEAANVRHEHEWRVWEDTLLPDGNVIIPGVVSHATNVVEHPDLVADRIVRFAQLVGRDNVIASTDCGLGGRVHPQIAFAKLESLGEGARRATTRLW